jgi:outer membrane protein OmpA-like peptidoglycan-associated protein
MTFRLNRTGRIGVIALSGAVVIALGSPAVADEEDGEAEQPPGYEAPEVPEIDPDSVGLMLADGADLAEPRVLDIKFITEDLGETGDTGETEDASAGGDGGIGGESGEGETDDDGQVPNGGGEQREEQTGSTRKFTLQTDVLFEEGSAELSEDARTALADVAAAINEYQPDQVNIFGFTDDQGSYESGEVLSADRAINTQQVLLELIENPGGINFNVRGYSEDYPLYDNATEEGRQGNRRVEISWPTGAE